MITALFDCLCCTCTVIAIYFYGGYFNTTPMWGIPQ